MGREGRDRGLQNGSNHSEMKAMATRATVEDLVAVGRSHIHTDGAAINLNTIHPLVGIIGGSGGSKGDEAETTAAAGVTIDNDLGLDDGTRRAVKGLVEALVSGTPAEVTDKKACS